MRVPRSGIYLPVVPLLLLLGGYHLRLANETLELFTTNFVHHPFEFQPLTNVVVRSSVNEVRLGDRILAINARPFRGESVYRQEAKKLYTGGLRPIPVTSLSKKGVVREIEVPGSHLHTGVPPLWMRVTPRLIVPIAIVTWGATVLLLRPRNRLVWIFFSLTLSISQVHPTRTSGLHWRDTVSPMEWEGWFRVGGVIYESLAVHTWPLWVFLFVVCFPRPYPQMREYAWPAWAVSLSLAAFAAHQTVFAVAQSEDFSLFRDYFEFWREWMTEALLALMLAAAGFFTFACSERRRSADRRTWILLIVSFVVAGSAFFVPPDYSFSTSLRGYWQDHKAPYMLVSSTRLDHSLWSQFYLSPPVVCGLFALAVFFLATAVKRDFSPEPERRQLRGLRRSMLLLLPLPLPMLLLLQSNVAYYWSALPPGFMMLVWVPTLIFLGLVGGMIVSGRPMPQSLPRWVAVLLVALAGLAVLWAAAFWLWLLVLGVS